VCVRAYVCVYVCMYAWVWQSVYLVCDFFLPQATANMARMGGQEREASAHVWVRRERERLSGLLASWVTVVTDFRATHVWVRRERARERDCRFCLLLDNGLNGFQGVYPRGWQAA